MLSPFIQNENWRPIGGAPSDPGRPAGPSSAGRISSQSFATRLRPGTRRQMWKLRFGDISVTHKVCFLHPDQVHGLGGSPMPDSSR